MKKIFKILIAVLILVAIVAVATIYIRSNIIDVLEPKGMVAFKERDIIITSSLLMLIIVVPTLFLAFIFAWRYRESRNAKHTPDWEHNSIAEYCWWGVPSVIIIVLAVITYRTSHELNPFTPLESDKKPIHIQAVALQWKWLFIYPEDGIATMNYIKFPVGTPINFEITADAPMNSFWIPQLGGQIYAMPAMRSKLSLIASETGTFRGLSTNFSGTGFAGMTFQAMSVEDAEYASWLAEAKSSSKSLDLAEYDQMVAPSENDPAETYVLKDGQLFNQILMKYMEPMN